MNALERSVSIIGVLAISVIVTTAAPAYAQNGTDETTEQSTSQQGRPERLRQSESESSTDEATHKRGNDQSAEHSTERSEKNKGNGDRTKKCESRKHGLQNKFTAIVTNSQRAQARITGVYDKAFDYQQTNNINSESVDDSVAKAAAAKTKSASSIAALAALKDSNLECANAGVGGVLVTFKTAAETTRSDLKAYRMAVKDVLKTLKDAKPSENNAEGSN